MPKVLQSILAIGLPVTLLLAVLALSVTGDAMATEGLKAIIVFLLLGCLAVAGIDRRITQIDIGEAEKEWPAQAHRKAA